MSAKRRVFPETFKREAVDRVASSGLSAGQVARELGMHETVLRRWMMQYGTQATGSARRPRTQVPAPPPSDLAAEKARLRRENDHLRMDASDAMVSRHIFGAADTRQRSQQQDDVPGSRLGRRRSRKRAFRYKLEWFHVSPAWQPRGLGSC